MIENKSEHVLYQPRPSQATLLFFSSLLLSLHYYRGYYMMDSWKYISEQKGLFISEESAFPVDSNGNGSYNKNNNVVIRNELNPIYSFQNYPPPVSNARAFDISELKEMYSNEPCGEVFSTGTGTDSCGNVVVSPFYDQEKDSSYHSLADYVQSKNRDLSIIDPTSSDVTMSRSVKRERFGTRLCGRSPCCQVFGCNKDLSSYKGYYKRHKVCDVHTKTSKVVIGGIEQRFCQQCSRFHLLAEFDDGKRSCRRRLAAHNKRRRKSQHASKSGTKDNISDLESLSTIQQTSSALSLLSAQSHNMPTQLLGASITSPLINKTNHLNSEKTAQSGSHTPGMYLESVNHDANNTTIDVKFQDNGISVGPYLRNNDYDNTNCHNNPLGRGIILDLLQLSSHLQRIEHQKHSTESGAG